MSRLAAYLEQRIHSALEWYAKCDAVPETVANIRKDLDSVVAETWKKFGLKGKPIKLSARLVDGFVVIGICDYNLS